MKIRRLWTGSGSGAKDGRVIFNRIVGTVFAISRLAVS
jgi:hypothetical protein